MTFFVSTPFFIISIISRNFNAYCLVLTLILQSHDLLSFNYIYECLTNIELFPSAYFSRQEFIALLLIFFCLLVLQDCMRYLLSNAISPTLDHGDIGAMLNVLLLRFFTSYCFLVGTPTIRCLWYHRICDYMLLSLTSFVQNFFVILSLF